MCIKILFYYLRFHFELFPPPIFTRRRKASTRSVTKRTKIVTYKIILERISALEICLITFSPYFKLSLIFLFLLSTLIMTSLYPLRSTLAARMVFAVSWPCSRISTSLLSIWLRSPTPPISFYLKSSSNVSWLSLLYFKLSFLLSASVFIQSSTFLYLTLLFWKDSLNRVSLVLYWALSLGSSNSHSY